jgi:hypothetical protein
MAASRALTCLEVPSSRLITPSLISPNVFPKGEREDPSRALGGEQVVGLLLGVGSLSLLAGPGCKVKGMMSSMGNGSGGLWSTVSIVATGGGRVGGRQGEMASPREAASALDARYALALTFLVGVALRA